MEQEFDSDKMAEDLLKVSKIRRPGAALHNVVMAMFLLLGESHREMADWKTLADMIAQTDKPEKQPIGRMAKLEAESIPKDQVHLAKKLLAPLTLDKVKIECDAAASCFTWSKGKIQEVEDHRRSLRKQRSNFCNDMCSSWLARNNGDSGMEQDPTGTHQQQSRMDRALEVEEGDATEATGKKKDKHEIEEEEFLVLKWLVNKDKII